MTASARRARPALTIDVVVDSDLWKERAHARSQVRRAVMQAAAALSTAPAELAIVLTDDSAIRELNRAWRRTDAATNVLAFPTKRAGGELPVIGDIVLAYETIAREARAARKPFAHHLGHLAVHGFLHLLGYDHHRNEDAEAMESLERDVLRRLHIPDPYRPRPRAMTRRPQRRSRKP
ncbi:MAG TPA: rRNA maturation RNase YbeY [Xanthobacteraceae bacterium]|nr:rRNA maturation RNase YbeY [Xanthobacteraceae bacterium]